MGQEIPELNSFADVVRWVIEDVGALCPSKERLLAYAANRQADEYRDVRFHVSYCRICQAELKWYETEC